MTALRPPPRPEAGHKGTFGSVVVVGGEATMPGAPALAAHAALRAGCGSVRIAAPAEVLALALAIEPSAIGIVLRGPRGDRSLAGLEGGALAIGCGWSASGHRGAIESAWRNPAPLVIDGGGLRALARCWPRLGRRTGATVLTPHPGEHADLAAALGMRFDPAHQAGRRSSAREVAEAIGAVVVLKGHGTVVSDGRRTVVNATGGPVLAIAGSGDVLAGVIASLLAQGMEPWDAARLGAAVHGLAGDLWCSAHGDRGMRAAELADLIPSAFRAQGRPSRRRSRPGGALR